MVGCIPVALGIPIAAELGAVFALQLYEALHKPIKNIIYGLVTRAINISFVGRTSGIGFIVIKKLSGRPEQPREGVTIIVEAIVVLLVFET